jgi:hypothetical protein
MFSLAGTAPFITSGAGGPATRIEGHNLFVNGLCFLKSVARRAGLAGWLCTGAIYSLLTSFHPKLESIGVKDNSFRCIDTSAIRQWPSAWDGRNVGSVEEKVVACHASILSSMLR